MKNRTPFFINEKISLPKKQPTFWKSHEYAIMEFNSEMIIIGFFFSFNERITLRLVVLILNT